MAVELDVVNRDDSLAPGMGDLVEVLGELKAGEMVVRIATDEIREGSAIRSQGK